MIQSKFQAEQERDKAGVKMDPERVSGSTKDGMEAGAGPGNDLRKRIY